MPENLVDVPLRGKLPNPPSAAGLQTTALRYAAGDLNASEANAFENLLASEQDARDALSEAVRLSAAALGQAPPTPHRSFRAAIREQLTGWCPRWLARRAYRGHPLAWAGLGAVAVGACTVFGLSLARQEPEVATTPLPSPALLFAVAPEPRSVVPEPVAVEPSPRERTPVALASTGGAEPLAGTTQSVAEIWADLSTPDHVEKAHDEELRWRHKLREIGSLHPGRPAPAALVDP